MASQVPQPHSPTALRGRRSRGTVSPGVWLRVSLEGLTKGPHTLSGSGIWTSTRKLFYLQHPGDTRSWLGPRPHPLWGALLGREKGGGPGNRDPSHFSPVS